MPVHSQPLASAPLFLQLKLCLTEGNTMLRGVRAQRSLQGLGEASVLLSDRPLRPRAFDVIHLPQPTKCWDYNTQLCFISLTLFFHNV